MTGDRTLTDFGAVANLVAAFGAVVEEGTLGMYAAELAVAGFEVFPLNGKLPAIGKAHERGDEDGKDCHGRCGRDGHGFWDGTTAVDKVREWWTAHPKRNIGVHVPQGVLVLDVDPRHRGDATVAALEEHFGRLPDTLTTVTGGGGLHLWFLHPGGDVSEPALAAWAKDHGGGQLADQGDKWLSGIDFKMHGAGYVVAPPSVHPESRRRYRWVDATAVPAELPRWLADLIRPVEVVEPVRPPRPARLPASLALLAGDGPADRFCGAHEWRYVLTGWTVVGGDGESDGSAWRHPGATGESSATIEHGLLFVYSTSTAFTPTYPQEPHGYTKFRAWATLNHGGDLSAAARAWVEEERVRL